MLFRHKTKMATEGTVQVGEHDIIHIHLTGHQTATSLKAFNKKVRELMAAQRTAGKKVYVFADLTGVLATSSGARQEAKEFLTTNYDALAIVGNAYLQPLILFTLRNTETAAAVRYFHTKTAAYNWLRRTPENHIYKQHNYGVKGKYGWVAFVAIVLLLYGTYAAWQQVIARNETRAQAIFDRQITESTKLLHERLKVYEATLQGFRGMFHASNEVNEKEFRDYYNSLNLAETNPGFNAITFVTRVPTTQLPSFLQKVKNDRSLYPEGHPNFTPVMNGERSEHFIVTFSTASANSSTAGIDLSNSEERLLTLESARDSGAPKATETINLFNSQGKEQEKKGFLITIPIYKDHIPSTQEERRKQHTGFINAIFDYEVFLNDVLKDKAPPEIAIKIYDNNKSLVHQHGNAMDVDARTAFFPFDIEGQTWYIEIKAPQTFGMTRSEINAPRNTLATGILISSFIVIILWLQNRARRRAFQLADTMTADLQLERNTAVETKNKDESILASIGDGVFALDEHNKIILFNKAAENISGFNAEDVIGKIYGDVLRFRDSHGDKTHNEFIHQAQKGKNASMEKDTFLVQKNGQLREVADSAAPIFDAKGKQTGIIVVFRDVTDEKKYQRTIQISNERFEMIAKATNDAVFDLDLSTGKMTWNKALFTQYGYKKSEVIPTIEWWVSKIHPEDSMKLEEEISHLLVSSIGTWESEYRFQRSDGTYAYVRARSFVQRDDSKNEPIRLISSMLDITKQKQLEQAKDEFISLISHQLRTPLTAIRLFTEMLVDGQVGKLTDAQQAYLEKVDISTKRMIQLVGDILNVSRIELGRLKISPTPTEVPALITSHIEEVEPLATAKNVKITFKSHSSPKIPLDAILYGQIVHNLLTNAIRYSNSKNGTVHVEFTKEGKEYILKVQDNGIGIPKEAQSRMFERFFRAQNAVKTEGEGTGLGLYLIKLVTQSSGGKVWFESIEGKGTTFYVSFPATGMVSKAGDKTLNQ